MGKKSRAILWLVVGACLLLILKQPVLAEEEKSALPAGLDLKVGEGPIQVSSKSLEWDHGGHKATFSQEVIARQEDLEIHCDALIIHFNESDNDVTRLIARGNVRIIQADRRAFCEEAVYDRSQNRIVLQGNPVLRQGPNEVKGERVIFYVSENRSVVDGGESGRVKVTLIPEQGENGD